MICMRVTKSIKGSVDSESVVDAKSVLVSEGSEGSEGTEGIDGT